MKAFRPLLLLAFCLHGCPSGQSGTPAAAPPSSKPAEMAPFGLIDCNQDGYLTADELQRTLTLSTGPIPRAEFDARDGNRDGRWSQQEYEAAMRRYGFPNWTAHDLCL